MNRLLNTAIVVSVVLAIALYAYYEWQPTDPGPPETEIQVDPGPVEPVPKIEDHVAAVAQQECWQHQECVTWNWLKNQGIELVCAEQDRPKWHGGKWTPRNYYNATVDVPCSRVVAVKISDRVEVRK